MILYTGKNSLLSHACRVVVGEKEVECEIVEVSRDRPQPRLSEINPYAETPTLADREIVVYDARVTAEYIDERFPHPPLMPVDPMNRAKVRRFIYWLCREYLEPLEPAASDRVAVDAAMRRRIRDHLSAMAPLFKEQPYLIGMDYTLADCFLAPLLWRTELFKVKLPPPAAPLVKYAEAVFARPGFQASLTEKERDMR
ncbi:MAG: glutathione S-transferase N-terminal domain-containing protein [Gammaproteobacteria bacterium]|nr:glutathione S-transferase N-terminal domain-containing protein [Gammaproteobacteria bacterium]MDD9799348.1 glutathione S-transferase N-terminal domain-containing protein [Gammaproteobacteria bacterium]MDD9814611.1 glutathione S-transferase N-terminal domain-containing protein [Gammaproteobacteria bacterium]MDD9850649.1 glutathione S-transferase N-terminal domain-containing protein [Gammaproteobacteria bacterium]MDD9870280.1 glutathione S-transferase N-terminal domain-containing protein [Gamm